jgi:hypothetical protein
VFVTLNIKLQQVAVGDAQAVDGQDVKLVAIFDLVRAGIVQRITRLINANYEFMGYIELANLVRRLTGGTKPDAIRAIKHEFNHRLLIVDEIHNVRSDEEANDAKDAKKLKEPKKGISVSEELYKLVRYADNLRLLLLSGTPMYNDPREVVWLLNLMTVNDRRATISVSDVFDRDGNLLRVNGRAVGAKLNLCGTAVSGRLGSGVLDRRVISWRRAVGDGTRRQYFLWP